MISANTTSNLVNRDRYNADQFTVATATTDYDVKTNEADSFGNVERVKKLRLTTDQTITVKFNSTDNSGVVITSSESPFVIEDIMISNIYISNASGNLATIGILSFG